MTEPGAVGQPGAAAPRPVEKERKAGAEAVMLLQQHMEETSVLANRLARETALLVSKNDIATFNNLNIKYLISNTFNT